MRGAGDCRAIIAYSPSLPSLPLSLPPSPHPGCGVSLPQSKPLIPLQKEEDPETHHTVLTNYMFPQQTRAEECEFRSLCSSWLSLFPLPSSGPPPARWPTALAHHYLDPRLRSQYLIFYTFSYFIVITKSITLLYSRGVLGNRWLKDIQLRVYEADLESEWDMDELKRRK